MSYYLIEREPLFTILTETYSKTFQTNEKTIGFMSTQVNTVTIEKIQSYDGIDKLLETYPRNEEIVQLLVKVQENSNHLQHTREIYLRNSSDYTALMKNFITRKFSNQQVANEFFPCRKMVLKAILAVGKKYSQTKLNTKQLWLYNF